jgi:hypothetical protein
VSHYFICGRAKMIFNPWLRLWQRSLFSPACVTCLGDRLPGMSTSGDICIGCIRSYSLQRWRTYTFLEPYTHFGAWSREEGECSFPIFPYFTLVLTPLPPNLVTAGVQTQCLAHARQFSTTEIHPQLYPDLLISLGFPASFPEKI